MRAPQKIDMPQTCAAAEAAEAVAEAVAVAARGARAEGVALGACAGAGTAKGSKMLCERAEATTMPEKHTHTYTDKAHTQAHSHID